MIIVREAMAADLRAATEMCDMVFRPLRSISLGDWPGVPHARNTFFSSLPRLIEML